MTILSTPNTELPPLSIKCRAGRDCGSERWLERAMAELKSDSESHVSPAGILNIKGERTDGPSTCSKSEKRFAMQQGKSVNSFAVHRVRHELMSFFGILISCANWIGFPSFLISRASWADLSISRRVGWGRIS